VTAPAWHGHSPESLADLILAAVHREYPSQIQHLLRSDDDVRAPRELTPAFYGSFDWHSAVHGHWALARLARTHPGATCAARARAALARSLTAENLAGELTYVGAPERESFERPYGLAWLLQLAAELRAWNDPEAARWREALAPLETLAVERLGRWLARLPGPVRSGVHSQTAFAFGLILDWAAIARDHDLAGRIATRAREWFGGDEQAPIAYEPSGNDFLSPALGEADLMRRVLAPADFSLWLGRFLGYLEAPVARRWLVPVSSPDPSDGHLAHLNGLNLSRAWMLDGVARSLGPGDARRERLELAAEVHARQGLQAVASEHYAGAHWLGSFAVYLLTAESS
jgi:hypothetical protein